LHEETRLILTRDDLTLLSDAPVRVVLPKGQPQLVYVFSAYVPIPYVTTHLRTPAQLEHAVTSQSTINHDGSYVVPATIDIDGLSLTTPVKQGLLQAPKREYGLLHFGFVTQWETFRRAVYTHQVLFHADTSIPRHFSCTLGLRLSTLIMFGCLSVAISISCVDRFRLTCAWELLSLQPTLLADPLPLPGLIVRLRLTRSFSLVVILVNLKTSSRRNCNISCC
jgi:hypothetical protein